MVIREEEGYHGDTKGSGWIFLANTREGEGTSLLTQGEGGGIFMVIREEEGYHGDTKGSGWIFLATRGEGRDIPGNPREGKEYSW